MRWKRLLADHCENCTLCRWARKNPQRLFGRLVNWHGTWCPCWKAWNDIYGKARP